MALKAVLDSVDELPEDVQKEYIERDGKFHLDVEGMKTQADIDRIQGALTKERNDHRTVREQLGTFKTHLGDRKIEDVVLDLDRIEEYKLAAEGKVDDEKINAIVEGRVRTKLAPVERERDQYKTKVGELEGTVQTFTAKERSRAIQDEARKAGAAAKILPEAMDDWLLLSERVFEVREDDGKVVAKDNVGFTPGVEPSVLITDLQAKRPHWWGESRGGGSRGNGGGPGGSTNPFSHEHWNMTKQGEVVNSDPAKADQLAKQAGTTVGGPRPKPRGK